MAAVNTSLDLSQASVSLDDTSVTEWRIRYIFEKIRIQIVSLDDTSVTEWRSALLSSIQGFGSVSLDDTSVTEWRQGDDKNESVRKAFHSMIPVLLNGGSPPRWKPSQACGFTR